MKQLISTAISNNPWMGTTRHRNKENAIYLQSVDLLVVPVTSAVINNLWGEVDVFDLSNTRVM
jgi:hypothetical protein